MKTETVIRANRSPSKDMLRLSAGEQSLELKDQGDGVRPKFSMEAYSGGPMRVWQFRHPIIIDLAGMQLPDKSRPILHAHRDDQPVGHSTRVWVEAGQLMAEGVLSGTSSTAEEIIASSRNGFPWQASVGAPIRLERVEFVRAGSSVKVNARTFDGPVHIARESRLKEISIVALGADDDTSTKIAARRQGAGAMEFEAWLRARGWDPDQLSDEQEKTLKAAWEGETKTPPKPKKDDDDDPVSIVRAKAAAENKRIGQIQEICQDYPTICAKAIEEGWEPQKAELEVLRAQRPNVSTVSRPGRRESQGQFTKEVVEAGLLASLGVADDARQKMFDERTLEAARPFEQMGLQELFMLSCQLDKVETPPIFGDGDYVIKAGFATMSLPGILENSLNKLALLAYRAADIQVMQFCRLGSTRDFKKVSRVRMLGSGRFERVGKAGELPSGKLGEQKFENQLDTYGQVLFIDRQTVINDDLQVLNDAASEIGNTGAEVLNHLGFTALLGAGSFFSAGNKNLSTGAAASGFGETGLKNAVTAFRKQKAGPGTKDKDQRPINIQPEILLVPVELEVPAQILTGSSEIRPGGGDDRGNFNPWRGRYKTVSAPHLSDTEAYPGGSATAWYLLANPNRLPAIELLFLNNRREPRVERVAPPPNQLGIGYRGYIDAGAEMMDPRAIHKSTGAD